MRETTFKKFFIIVIYYLWPTYSFRLSFLTASLEIVALTISRIYLIIKIVDNLMIRIVDNLITYFVNMCNFY